MCQCVSQRTFCYPWVTCVSVCVSVLFGVCHTVVLLRIDAVRCNTLSSAWVCAVLLFVAK